MCVSTYVFVQRRSSLKEKKKNIIIIIVKMIIIHIYYQEGVLHPTATRDGKQAAFIEHTPVTMVTHTDIITDLHFSLHYHVILQDY